MQGSVAKNIEMSGESWKLADGIYLAEFECAIEGVVVLFSLSNSLDVRTVARRNG